MRFSWLVALFTSVNVCKIVIIICLDTSICHHNWLPNLLLLMYAQIGSYYLTDFATNYNYVVGPTLLPKSLTWLHIVSYFTDLTTYCQLFHRLDNILSVISQTWQHIVSYFTGLTTYCQLSHWLDNTLSVISLTWQHIVSYLTDLTTHCQLSHRLDNTLSVVSLTWQHIVSYLTDLTTHCQLSHWLDNTLSVISLTWQHIVSYLTALTTHCQLSHWLDNALSVISPTWQHIVNCLTDLTKCCHCVVGSVSLARVLSLASQHHRTEQAVRVVQQNLVPSPRSTQTLLHQPMAWGGDSRPTGHSGDTCNGLSRARHIASILLVRLHTVVVLIKSQYLYLSHMGKFP